MSNFRFAGPTTSFDDLLLSPPEAQSRSKALP